MTRRKSVRRGGRRTGGTKKNGLGKREEKGKLFEETREGKLQFESPY